MAGFANKYQKPLGYQQLTGSSTMTLTAPAGSTMALIAVEGNAVRWRDDGTNPTASIGMPMSVGQEFSYMGTISALVFIPQTGSATIDVAYYA